MPEQPRDSDSVLSAAGSMGAAVLLSRVLGLVREQCFAILFGAGAATDAFYMAFRVPSLLRNLFAEGALSAILVPSLARAEAEGGRERAWRLAGLGLRLLLALTAVAAFAGVLISPALVGLFASAFKAVPGKFELTVRLTRWIFPFFPMVVLSAALMGVLNYVGRFFIPALSSAAFNLVSVACGVALVFVLRAHPVWGIAPVVGMAWGVLLGGAAQVLIQLPSLRSSGYRFPGPRPTLASYWDPDLSRMLGLLLPGAVGLAATQINILVNSILATGQQQGAVSALNYAFRLMQFPIGLFGVSLASAVLPRVSQQWARGEIHDFEHTLRTSLKQLLAINLPAAAGLAFLAEPIIRLIFQYGHFSAEATHATALALMGYSVGLWAHSGAKLLVPMFYAANNTRIPVISSAISVICNIVLNLLLLRPLGFWGLALGTSITAVLNLGFLLWTARAVLREGGGKFSLLPLARSFVVVLIISLSMGFLCLMTAQRLELLFPESVWLGRNLALVLVRFAKLSVVIVIGVIWWAGVSWIFGERDALEVGGFFAKKLKKKLSLRNN